MCRESTAGFLTGLGTHSRVGSGGPFLDLDADALAAVTPAAALKHPTWQMGSKITIDSATLVNKGLDAGAVAKAICELQGGKGGGRKDFAQGGGPDYDWEELVTKVKALVTPR